MLDASVESSPWSERMAVRFGASVFANLIRGGLSLLGGILVARGLGASGYGDLNFLLGSFTAISHLLEMGTSSAFYTFISRCRRGRNFFLLYLGWLAFQFFAVVLTVSLLLPDIVVQRVWIGHERRLVLMAFVATFFVNQGWGLISQLGEAMRKTVLTQALAVAQAVVHLFLIVAALHWKWLSVEAVLWLLAGEYALLGFSFGPMLVQKNAGSQPDPLEKPGKILAEFVTYCKPLIVYVWVSFLYVFTDKWLLQAFGGAKQQGFFAVGQQFANVSLLATASIVKVFWKEIAEAHERQDHRRVQSLYFAVTRGLYLVSAVISCLLIPYSREILDVTVGPGYEAAWPCLALLFLYPLHQSLGQIQGIFFFATGETGKYTRWGVVMTVIGVPMAYFALAPSSAPVPGFGLGAVGLASKEVIFQILSINFMAYLIARSNGWEHDYRHQVIVLVLLLSMGWFCKEMSGVLLALLGVHGNLYMGALLGSCLYVWGVLILLFKFPSAVGLSRDQVQRLSATLRKRPWPATA